MERTIHRHYHFYASHRNELLNDKCQNLHGHQYELTVVLTFGEKQANGVCMLFSDIDKVVSKLIQPLDHSFIGHKLDPMLFYLQQFDVSKLYQENEALLTDEQKEHWQKCISVEKPLQLNQLPAVTSVENLSEWIYRELVTLFAPYTNVKIKKIIVKETKSASVSYEP